MSGRDFWQRFGRWRRVRPFWGGLLMLLSAGALFLSANLTFKAMEVHFGQEGFLSYLLPLVMLLCGLLSWFTPGQRVFYAIVGLLTAVYSLIGLNLGGFGAGMLLGIAGGALVIAWTPVHSPVAPAAAPPAAAPPAAAQEPPPFAEPGHPGHHRKALAIIAAPLVIGLSLALAAHAPRPAMAGPACPKGMPSRSTSSTSSTEDAEDAGRPAGKEAGKEDDEKPGKNVSNKAGEKADEGAAKDGEKAEETAEAAKKDDGDTGNPIVDGWNDFVEGVGDLFGGGGDPAPSPSPGASSAAPAPSGVNEAPAAPAVPGKTAPPTEPKPSDREIPCLGPRLFGKKADPGDLPAAAIAGGLMEGRSLTMYDSTYDGVTTLRTADGPKRVLQFSMRKSVTVPFKLTIREAGGHTTVIDSGNLTTTGNVRFYTPKFQGKLFGLIPVTFTPDRPPPLTLPVLKFTDVKIDLSLVRSDVLTGKPLRITEVP